MTSVGEFRIERDLRVMSRVYDFPDADAYKEFDEAYRSLDRLSNDSASYFELRMELLAGNPGPAVLFFESVHKEALRHVEADNRRASDALRFAAQMLVIRDEARAMDVATQATRVDPQSASAWLTLATIQARLPEERTAARQSLLMAARLAGSDVAVFHAACWKRSDLEGAAGKGETAFAWSQRSLQAAHDNARRKASIATSMRLGAALVHYACKLALFRSLDACRPFAEQACDLWKRIGAAGNLDKDAATVHEAGVWREIAESLIVGARFADAELAARRTLVVLEQAYDAAPGAVQLQKELATGYLLMAHIARRRQNLGEALAASRKAAALRSLLFLRDADDLPLGLAAAEADASAGRAHLVRQELAEAARCFDRAIERWRAVGERDPLADNDVFLLALTLAQRASTEPETSVALMEQAYELLTGLAARGPLTDEQDDLLADIEDVLSLPERPANDA